jgi:glucokinase
MVAVRADKATPGRRWRRRLSAPPSPNEALAALDTLIGQALDNETEPAAQPAAIGLALWDSVDPARGVVRGVRHAPDPSDWDDFPLAAGLAERWRAPVRLQSAAVAAGLAEATLGAGQGYRVALYLHSGRTIASALIAGGEVSPDATGRAGMLGHWLVAPDGPRCACGLRGHLDPLASAQSIVRATIGLASGSDESTAAMLRVSGGRAEAMTVKQVTQLVGEGDPAARTVLERAWDALALALANLVAALDPGVIILGGAPAEAGEAFCGPLRERLAALCGTWRPTPELLPGKLEARSAALVGAGLLAQRAASGWR